MDALKERLTARWTIVYRDGRVPLSAPGASAAGAERLHLLRVTLRAAPNGLTWLDTAMASALGEM